MDGAPFEKKLMDGIHALGGRTRLHICGNTGRILPDMMDSGADIIDHFVIRTEVLVGLRFVVEPQAQPNPLPVDIDLDADAALADEINFAPRVVLTENGLIGLQRFFQRRFLAP